VKLEYNVHGDTRRINLEQTFRYIIKTSLYSVLRT
jgi:hypothetical protein